MELFTDDDDYRFILGLTKLVAVGDPHWSRARAMGSKIEQYLDQKTDLSLDKRANKLVEAKKMSYRAALLEASRELAEQEREAAR